MRRGRADEGVARFLDAVCLEPRWEDGTEEYRAMTLTNAKTITEQVRESRPRLAAQGLQKISRPVLLMIGARSISPFPETPDRLQELVPHAERAAVPDASRMINVDNKADFLTIPEGFLIDRLSIMAVEVSGEGAAVLAGP